MNTDLLVGFAMGVGATVFVVCAGLLFYFRKDL